MENWQSFSNYKNRCFLFFHVFSVFANILLLVMPIYSLQIFNRVLSSQSEDTLLYLALIALILVACQAIFDFIRQQILNNLSLVYDGLFERKIVSSTIKNSAIVPAQKDSFIKDHQLSKQYLSSPFNRSLADLPWTFAFIVVLFSLHYLLGLYALTSVIILAAINGSLMMISSRSSLESRRLTTKQALSLQSILGRNKVDRAPLYSHRIIERWQQRNSSKVFQEVDAKNIHTRGQSIAKLFRMAVQVGVYGVGAWLVIEGDIMSGSLLASSILLARILSPIDQGAAHYFSWRESRLAYKRVSLLLQDGNRNENSYLNVPLESIEISVDKVLVTGDSDRQLLKNISFNLKAGNFLCIRGASGSGKSTLLKAIAGCIEPNEGQIRYNGVPREKIDPSRLASVISYGSQIPELFEATIAENISNYDRGDDITVSQRIIEVSREFACHEFIAKLPKSYSTTVGSGSLTLSPKENQKLSLASCFYAKPKLLVLDDPTVYLDKNESDLLLSNLAKLKETGSTAIIVSDDASLIGLCDYIIELNNGSVIKAFENKSDNKTDKVVSHLTTKSFKY